MRSFHESELRHGVSRADRCERRRVIDHDDFEVLHVVCGASPGAASRIRRSSPAVTRGVGSKGMRAEYGSRISARTSCMDESRG